MRQLAGNLVNLGSPLRAEKRQLTRGPPPPHASGRITSFGFDDDGNPLKDVIETKWWPGADPPAYLKYNTSYPKGANYGFDPFGLGADPARLAYYKDAELQNGRWAMIALLGMTIPGDFWGLPRWWEAGAEAYSGWPLGFSTLVGLQIFGMGVLEYTRYQAWKKTGESGIFGIEPFDPLGYNSEEMRVREIKHARLAMLACIGAFSAGMAREMTPWEALKAHVADPVNVNIYTSGKGPETLFFLTLILTLPLMNYFIFRQPELAYEDAENFVNARKAFQDERDQKFAGLSEEAIEAADTLLAMSQIRDNSKSYLRSTNWQNGFEAMMTLFKDENALATLKEIPEAYAVYQDTMDAMPIMTEAAGMVEELENLEKTGAPKAEIEALEKKLEGLQEKLTDFQMERGTQNLKKFDANAKAGKYTGYV